MRDGNAPYEAAHAPLARRRAPFAAPSWHSRARMPHIPGPGSLALVVRASHTLRFSQRELAKLLGVSRRTITRLFKSSAVPYSSYLHTLARAVHAEDPSLAAELAAEGGQTLEGLDIVRPAPPPLPAPPKLPPVRLMVDSVVCAAADAMQTPPAGMREALRAAFARARGLGLTIEEIDDALSPAPAPVEIAANPEMLQAKASRARRARGGTR